MNSKDEPAPLLQERDCDRSTQPAKSGSGALWAGGIVIALVLYVLSFGPVFRLGQAGKLSVETFQWVYAPIFLVLNTKTGETYLGPTLNWYVMDIWGA